EVDEHPPAPLLLPPGGGDELGSTSLQLSGDGDGGGAGLVGRPARLESYVDVYAAIARGLGQTDDAHLVEEGGDLVGRLLDHGKGDTGAGVQVDAHLVGVLGVSGLGRPDVEAEARQVDRPQDVRQIGGNQRHRGGAVRGG